MAVGGRRSGLGAFDDAAARNLDGTVVPGAMAEADEVLAEFGALWRFAEAERLRGVEARVADVVVDDEIPQGRANDPHSAVRNELPQAVAEEKLIEGGLPNSAGVAGGGQVCCP